MHGGGEELGAGGFGLGELGFQGVAQGQQLGDLGDDSLLLGEWRDGQHDPLQESSVEAGARHSADSSGDLLCHEGSAPQEKHEELREDQ